jgi:UDP-2,3-diacylglucosamine hydrolase
MAGKLGILAGGGDVPARLVAACHEEGREVFVLAFEGQTDPSAVRGAEHAWSRLGAFGSSLQTLRKAGVRDLVMAGPIRRPSMRELRPDLRGLQFFAKAGIESQGDDGLLRAVISGLEEEGFRLLGIDDVLSGVLAEEGRLGKHAADKQAEIDIARGMEVALALGTVDVGQSVVVQGGIVLGVEAIEGTDRLLARCKDLRRAGPGGVLVKMKKPGQDSRVDLPTVGPRTVRNAASAGLRGIAFQAGATLVIGRDKMVAAADRAGLFVIGIQVTE